MADLRDEIAEAVRVEVERLGAADVSKAALYHRFQDRGASRATVYRAIDDGLRLVAERGASRPVESVAAQTRAPVLGSAPTIRGMQMAADARLDPGALLAVIAEIDHVMAQARRDATTIPAAVIAIRHALTRLHASAGQSDQAEQLIRGVFTGLRQGDPTFCTRAATIFIQLGGQTT
jgi:hypothetical protein